MMARTKKAHGKDPREYADLQVDEDLEFQSKEWRIERAGWVGMAILLTLAALGLFGGGPLSTARSSAVGGLHLEFSRFTRLSSRSEMRVELPAEAVSEGQAVFWIDNAYLDRVQIESLRPEPQSMAADGDRTIFIIQAEAGQPAAVLLELKPQRPGVLRGQVGSPQAGAVSFNQWVFP